MGGCLGRNPGSVATRLLVARRGDNVAAIFVIVAAAAVTRGASHAGLLEEEKYAAFSSGAIDAVVRSARTGDPLGG